MVIIGIGIEPSEVSAFSEDSYAAIGKNQI